METPAVLNTPEKIKFFRRTVEVAQELARISDRTLTIYTDALGRLYADELDHKEWLVRVNGRSVAYRNAFLREKVGAL